MSLTTGERPDETIALEGVVNFRDFGGYTAAGRRVKTGRLYRSGHRGEATDADLADTLVVTTDVRARLQARLLD
jgi:protein tyrosine/serine phosphatase